ncbi:hypothetical protein DY000_02052706 [Brassica cretica]|uniref:PPM-type phosphatase domain-containing protein n=1 Tax=Brassica cretica TaxID=69181 RepID=A0ABQ7AKN7_BRACR|nr:hypothetical protein DY000_02052706 [Brassica cretica]
MRRTRVVVLCTESVVCGLASHTSLGDSPVAHPSFFPLQERVVEVSPGDVIFAAE